MSSERNEEIRSEALAYLAPRQGIAQTPETILRRINKEHKFTMAELESALAFLEGMDPPLVAAVPAALGATKYYQATSAGVLHYERSL